jgi:ACS family glucarate transporter-like MFS transporter
MSPETKIAADVPSLRESSERWWLMALLLVGMIFCYAQRGTLSVAAPFMVKELGLSPAVMGILLSAFFWSYALMQVPAGWMVDRFGVRRVYGWGFACWSAASAGLAFAPGPMALILLRMFQGIGQSVAFPASSRAVANWFQERERATVTAGYLIGVRLGQAAVTAVGAFLLAAYGWKPFFLATGLTPLIWLPLWLGFLGKWEKESANLSLSDHQTSSRRSASFTAGLALLKQKSLLGIFLGFFAYDYVWFLYVNWLPGYLMIERGFSAREMGVYSSLPFLVMSLAGLLSGVSGDWLVRRGLDEIKVRKIFVVIGLSVACLIVPAALVESHMRAVGLLTLSLVGLGIASPNCWTLTQAVCPKQIVGTAAGIQNFGGNLSGIIAPALTGYIAHVTNSFTPALSLAGLVLLSGVLSYGLLVSKKVEIENI